MRLSSPGSGWDVMGTAGRLARAEVNGFTDSNAPIREAGRLKEFKEFIGFVEGIGLGRNHETSTH